jgi:membrane protein required for colicin V production
MQVLDWVFLAGLVFSLLVGAWRGLVVEVLSVLSWIAAFFLAQWFAPDVARWLPIDGATEVVRYAAGFVLVFVATVFFGSLLAFVIKKLLTAVGMRPADRLLGAAFGLVRGVVMVLAVTVVVGMTPARAAGWWQDAVTPQVATVVLQGLKPVLPQEFGKYLP